MAERRTTPKKPEPPAGRIRREDQRPDSEDAMVKGETPELNRIHNRLRMLVSSLDGSNERMRSALNRMGAPHIVADEAEGSDSVKPDSLLSEISEALDCLENETEAFAYACKRIEKVV